jgi:hypothetical protein
MSRGAQTNQELPAESALDNRQLYRALAGVKFGVCRFGSVNVLKRRDRQSEHLRSRVSAVSLESRCSKPREIDLIVKPEIV